MGKKIIISHQKCYLCIFFFFFKLYLHISCSLNLFHASIPPTSPLWGFCPPPGSLPGNQRWLTFASRVSGLWHIPPKEIWLNLAWLILSHETIHMYIFLVVSCLLKYNFFSKCYVFILLISLFIVVTACYWSQHALLSQIEETSRSQHLCHLICRISLHSWPVIDSWEKIPNSLPELMNGTALLKYYPLKFTLI